MSDAVTDTVVVAVTIAVTVTSPQSILTTTTATATVSSLSQPSYFESVYAGSRAHAECTLLGPRWRRMMLLRTVVSLNRTRGH